MVIKTNLVIWYTTLKLQKDKQYEIIQKFQNKVLKNKITVSWYLRKKAFYKDLKTETVDSEIKK